MRINSKGQITIPKHIREQAGLLPGTHVSVGYIQRNDALMTANFVMIQPKMDLDALRAVRESMPRMEMSHVELIRKMRDGEIEE